MYDVTVDVYSSRVMWFSWVAAFMNMCQSVLSKQSCRAAVASSVHTSTDFSDGLNLLISGSKLAGEAGKCGLMGRAL